MKTITLAAVLILTAATTAFAQYTTYGTNSPYGGGLGTGSNPNSVYHQGYTTRSGTTVQPHYQTAPNHTQYDNYGTSGNFNPHTGAYGTRTPHY